VLLTLVLGIVAILHLVHFFEGGAVMASACCAAARFAAAALTNPSRAVGVFWRQLALRLEHEDHKHHGAAHEHEHALPPIEHGSAYQPIE
jgi:hypothetical protein